MVSRRGARWARSARSARRSARRSRCRAAGATCASASAELVEGQRRAGPRRAAGRAGPGRAAQGALRLAVDVRDEVLAIDADQRIGRVLQQLQHAGLGLLRALEQAVPAHQRVDARQQLGIGVGLDQIVVRARRQALDDLLGLRSAWSAAGWPVWALAAAPGAGNGRPRCPTRPGMTQSSTSTSGAAWLARCSSSAEPSAKTSTVVTRSAARGARVPHRAGCRRRPRRSRDRACCARAA